MRNKRERYLLTVAVIVVTIVVGNLLVLQPLLTSWNIRDIEIIRLEGEIKNGNELILPNPDKPGAVTREESYKKIWATYLGGNLNSTNTVAEEKVWRAIEKWRSKSRISLTSVKPQWQNHEYEFLGKEPGENKTHGYRTYDVRLVAEGTMQEAVKFVHAIESDELPLKIEQLELASREKTGKLISVSVHFTGLQLGEALQ